MLSMYLRIHLLKSNNNEYEANSLLTTSSSCNTTATRTNLRTAYTQRTLRNIDKQLIRVNDMKDRRVRLDPIPVSEQRRTHKTRKVEKRLDVS